MSFLMCVSSQIIALNTMFLFHLLMIHKDIYCLYLTATLGVIMNFQLSAVI